MRSKAWSAFILIFLLAGGLGAAFGPADVKVHQLDNGLKVLLVEDHDIPNVALYTFFRVGSRNERPGLTGVSHFIEHMMFNGTAKFGPGEFDRTMEFRGGRNNAYTSQDLTAYTDWFPAAALEHMIDMEADRIQGLTLVPEVLESERGVIASERRLGVENDNDAILQENVRATAIMAHPYHWDVIGWMSDILSWRRDEVLAYYRTYYAPDNAVLVIVGDIDPARTLALIQKYYGPVPKAAPPPPVTTTEPPQMGPKDVLIRKEAQTPSFYVVWHGPAFSQADFIPLSILEKPLLAGDSSRLHRRLVREEQLAISVSGGIQATLDPFLFEIFVKPRPGADLERIGKVIDEELARVAADGITDAEFKKALNIIRSDYYSDFETIAGRANVLGTAEALYGGWEKAFTLVASYEAATRDGVREAARKIFQENNKTVGKLIPEGGAK